MAYRKLKNNTKAQTGVMLVLIPFAITVILFTVSVPLTVPSETRMMTIGGIWLDVPEDYENMTWAERSAWVNNSHGGNWTEITEWRDPYWWEWALMPVGGLGGIAYLADTWGNGLITYPDGTTCRQDDLEKFIKGQAFETDWKGVVESIVTLDPPVLEFLGVYGTLIRLLLVVCVAIGLVEILWIG